MKQSQTCNLRANSSYFFKSFFCPLALSLGIFSSAVIAAELQATDYGVVADGKTDDGPAIAKLLAAAKQLNGEAVTLVFPKGKTIHASTAADRYLFSLRNGKNITIEGNGSTFLLDPKIRMVDLHFANNVVMKNFQVDYSVSMFIETILQSINQSEGYVDVIPVLSHEATSLREPTKQDGEQWFGGFLWLENGSHPKAASHYEVRKVEQLGDGLVRIYGSESALNSSKLSRIIPGTTAFSIPRAGVAHRYGPGALFNVHDAKDISFEKIQVWSAPWFVFSIYRCEGFCKFSDVDVVPKPKSGRWMSACRDAFHVTANRAKLLFEYCDTEGLGDDDYNFCILSSMIHKVISPTEIVIQQKFPIQYNPLRVGETLMVMNEQNTLLGSSKIVAYTELPNKNGMPIIAGGSAPFVTLRLETPIEGLKPRLTVWSKEASNPDTIMSHCTATFSIRMQTSLKINDCRFRCYNVSHFMSPGGPNVEGPGPEYMIIKNTRFEVGRGSGYAIQSGGEGPIDQNRLQNVEIENCTFHVPLTIDKAKNIQLINNRFHDKVNIGPRDKLEMRDNTLNGESFSLK